MGAAPGQLHLAQECPAARLPQAAELATPQRAAALAAALTTTAQPAAQPTAAVAAAQPAAVAAALLAHRLCRARQTGHARQDARHRDERRELRGRY